MDGNGAVTGLVSLIAFSALAAGQPAAKPVRPPLVVSAERVLAAPGPVLRAQSLVGAPPLPADGVTVTFDCMLAPTGFLERCADAAGASAWTPFAARRLSGFRIDVEDLALAPLARAPARITVSLLPADRRDLKLAEPIAPNPSLVTFVQAPSGSAASAFYPSRAVRADIQPRVAVACRILEDGALFCPRAAVVGEIAREEIAGGALREQFAFAAQQATGMMRAALTLKDGRPAAGHQFHMVVAFRLNAD